LNKDEGTIPRSDELSRNSQNYYFLYGFYRPCGEAEVRMNLEVEEAQGGNRSLADYHTIFFCHGKNGVKKRCDSKALDEKE